MSNFNRSLSFNRRSFSGVAVDSPRSAAFKSPLASVLSSPRASNHGSPRCSRPYKITRLFQMLVICGSLASFSVIVAVAYLYVLPNLGMAFLDFKESHNHHSSNKCDLFYGSWVVDDSYPLYNASECPFVEQGFNCLQNGRKDYNYLKWRWQPKHCNIPTFNVHDILERLRGRRVVFVGDSMSRTQWESLICLLLTGVEDKDSVYEVNGNNITKRTRYLGVRFSSFNFTIEFYRSVFLMQHGWMTKHAPKRVRSTLRLDKIDDINHEWISADYLIFNTGQWWVPGKLFHTGCYFQVGNSVKLGMSIPVAYSLALHTWASWVERKINTSKTHVLFRTFEPSHWGENRTCEVTFKPASDTEGREHSMFTDTVLEVTRNMKIPVTVLQITSMSASRSDAHVGLASDKPLVPDCSHWCLPGLPDTWNEILLTYMLTNFEREVSQRSARLK